MIMNFSVDFANDTSTYTLNFRARNTAVGQRWYQLLCEHVAQDATPYEPTRLYNFPQDPWTEQELVQELNRCIDVVNAYQPVIHHRAELGMSQHTFNELHHYFEVLRGEQISSTDFYTDSPPHVQRALNDYNVAIHRTEAHRQQQTVRAPRVVYTFECVNRWQLEESDYDFFETRLRAGTVFVNYCQVGKPVLDAFRDRDTVIFDDAIRPLQYLGPDFAFYLADTEEDTQGLVEWLQENNRDPGDPRLAIGQLPVADVQFEHTIEHTIEQIAQRQTIAGIHV